MNKEQIVQIEKFRFKLLYTRQQISQQIDRVASEIDTYLQKVLTQDPSSKFMILGVLNGAFMFTSEIVRRLKTPVMVDFIKVKSYKGMESGELTIQSQLNFALFKDMNVIILDDICDTGKTLAQLAKTIQSMTSKPVKIAVLVTRPDKNHEVEPNFSCVTCSAFIIGHGLDYNYQGRQYPEIYQKYDE